MRNPKQKAWLWLDLGFASTALGLFLSAGTIRHWQEWVFLAVGVGSGIPLNLYISNDRRRPENRTKARPAAE